MKAVNLTRLTMGVVLLVGLLAFVPLAYFVAGMMIFAGLTGICFLEKFYSRALGLGSSCSVSQVNEATSVTRRRLSGMTPEDIKRAVSDKYSQVATKPTGRFNFPVGRKFAQSVGYPRELLHRLPASFGESFTGAGNPHPFIELRAGETVLDLGCGAGLDMYIYAQAAGPGGKIYGVDISEEMLTKAKANLEKVGVKNVELRLGESDRIPLEVSSVDLVASNGIYNLSPDKEAVMREVLRVLKPGGRTVFSEIVLKSELPEKVRKDIDDWFRCIGGALTEEAFIGLMREVGFERVEVLAKGRNARTGHELALCATIRAFKPTPAASEGRP